MSLKKFDMETWKPIAWSKGQLEVSNLGRVRSLMRDGRILKAQPDRKGYLRICVTIERVKTTFKVHREVAQAFIPNPNDLPQVNHKDGEKTNNRADNLEWVTNAQNQAHAIASGLRQEVFRAAERANEARKRAVYAVNIHTNERLYFPSISAAEQAIGTKHINECINGRRSHAKGYSFHYADTQRG